MLVDSLKIRWSYQDRNTTCTVSDMDNTVIVSNTVKRFITDTPNKRLARKISFSRAMKTAADEGILPKPVRTNIWTAFRSIIKQPVAQR